MPLEIRELHIKIMVNQEPEEAAGAVSAPTEGATTPRPGGDTSTIIAHCVEQVLEILQEKMEA